MLTCLKSESELQYHFFVLKVLISPLLSSKTQMNFFEMPSMLLYKSYETYGTVVFNIIDDSICKISENSICKKIYLLAFLLKSIITTLTF